MVAVGKGAQAAGYQGHCAEAGAGMADCVGAGGVLLVVLAVTRGLQPVVCTCKGHLHGCSQTQRPLESFQHGFGCALKVVRLSSFVHLKLKVTNLGQFCKVLLNLIWTARVGRQLSVFLLWMLVGVKSHAGVYSREGTAVARSCCCQRVTSCDRDPSLALTPPENVRGEDGDEGGGMKERGYRMSSTKSCPVRRELRKRTPKMYMNVCVT